MNPRIAHDFLVPAAMTLFDSRLSTPPARAMVLAIGMQESDFQHRQQLIGHHRNWWESVKGPAVSFWQFEKVGITGVLEHPASRGDAIRVLETLGYPADVNVLHEAMKHNDLLAAAWTRLALRRLPQPLPGPDDVAEGWEQYVAVWRPGKPKPERWAERYARAWHIVGIRA